MLLHSRSPVPWLLALILTLSLAGSAQAAAPDLEEADLRLEHLDKLLSSSRTVNEELLAALDQVEASYLGMSHDVPLANEAAAQKWCGKAEKLYLKAFTLVKLDRREKTRNVREIVNRHAAQIVGRTGHSALWKKLKRGLETRYFRARHEVSERVLAEAFDAIAALGDPEALAWMAEEFIHTNSSPEKVVDRLVAAQQAFVKFPLERVSGPMRHAIFKRLIQLYPATEAVARQNSNQSAVQSTKRFWDRIRTGVILAAQHFASTPRNEDGEALATMKELAEWFRDHKSVRKAPWADLGGPRG